MKQIRRISAIAWLALAGTIALGSLIPKPALDGVASERVFPDKVQHSGAYFGLAMLGFFSVSSKSSLGFVIAVELAFGGVLELLQGVTATRTAALDDLTANIAGILAGSLAGVLLVMISGRLEILRQEKVLRLESEPGRRR